MNDSNKGSVHTQLAALQLAFYEGLPTRLSTIKDYLSELQNDQQTDHLKTLSDFHLHVHSLAGTAGIYNAREIFNAAKKLEAILLEKKSSTSPSLSIENIEAPLHALETSIMRWQPTITAPICNLLATEKYIIYLITDSHTSSLLSQKELAQDGFILKLYKDLEALHNACLDSAPSAIILDTDFSDHDIALLNEIKQLQKTHSTKSAIICVASDGDPKTRLAAARVGITTFFTRPVNKYTLLKTIKQSTEHYNPEVFRVLIIDDDRSSRQYYTEVLKRSGILVKSINNPLGFIDAIEQFKPELILLDVYMPECSGLEVAAMIRQDTQYSEIPIIFLSGESNISRQMVAINMGADDFFTKPVDPGFLVSAITARLHRIRKLKQLNTMINNTVLENEYKQFALDQHAIVSTTDASGIITYANEKFCDISGYEQSELLGSKHNIVKSDFHSASFFDELWATITSGKVWRGEICNKRKNGSHYWVSSTIIPFVDSDGKPYQYTSIRTDISAQKMHEQDLFIAKTEAEEANRAKSQFLANMSHELRTPMNAILGFAQLLEADGHDGLSESQLDNVNEILKAGNHLLELINEVLDLSRIEAGRINLELSAVSVHGTILECIGLMQPLLEKYSVKIDYCSANDPDIYFRADRFRLKQVLLNLISNAIKYNRRGGGIFISCYSENNHGFIEIQDTGVGIPDERLNELFHPFSRLAHERSGIEGSGIGLVITKQLVELMGGKIGVKSRDTRGSTFWVQLPIELSNRPNKDSEDMNQNDSTIPREFSILYIEDNPTNIRLITRLLSRRPDIHLWTAHEPFLGIELAIEHQPNLILLDINLPIIDGYEVMQQLQANPKTNTIPIVAITANTFYGSAEKAKQAGFSGFLSKPINIDAFFEVIDNTVAAQTPG